MDAREYLGEVKKADAKLYGLRSEIKRLEELSKNLSSKPFDREKVSASGDQDKVATITARLMDKKAQYAKLIDKNEQMRDTVISQIYSLDDTTSSQILFFMYIENRSYHEIAKETNYSYDHVRRLCRKAESDFEKECLKVC
jgi:DNA-directed RNA polymerase specialized sigma subunit